MNTHKICPAPQHAGPRWVSVLNFGVERWDRAGRVPLVLHGWCRGCRARLARGYNARMRALEASGDARGVAWGENRRRTNREANITRARKNGAVPRHELGGGGPRIPEMKYNGLMVVDAGPFLVWLDDVVQRGGLDVRVVLGDTMGRAVNRARRSGRVTEQLVDAVCVALGQVGVYEEIVRGGSAGISGVTGGSGTSG